MDKTVYKSHKKNLREKHQEIKNHYKKTRPSLKERVNTVLNRVKYPFVVVNNKIHKKRNDIKELATKLDYIVNSLKATANTTDEVRKKTIEDIIENIDNL